ncbi:MAG: hypothetical protein IPP90_15680 [Gemmatimonadaceae bacterium]|nr:hypothetical protein [Gemmatimonadaceae bacterium]
MTAAVAMDHAVRFDAARLAYALLRMEEPMASILRTCKRADAPVLGEDAYSFTPSWELIPRAEIVPFLVSLPSPALLAPTTTRGVVALTLLHELTGDRRRWGEKVLSNFSAGLDRFILQLGLTDDTDVLLEFEQETEVYSLAAVRMWTQQYGVLQVGWSLAPLRGDARAQAQLVVCRSDGQWFPSTQIDQSPGAAT